MGAGAHLVAPDIGTSTAMFVAAAHSDLLSSVVVGSGAAAVPLQLSGPLADWVNGPDLDRLPNGKLVIVDAGHFVWEERADEYASLIATWVADGYLLRGTGRLAGTGVVDVEGVRHTADHIPA